MTESKSQSKSIIMFNTAAHAFAACSDFRKNRRRFLRFAYGRQWEDLVADPRTGAIMTEGELASRNGSTPLTNNLIRQIVKTVVGRYRNIALGSRHDDDILAGIRRDNQLDELDARNLEEFLISGAAIQKISLRYDGSGAAVPFVENVSPGKFFVNNISDPRGFDADLIGMLHDLGPGQLLRRFSCGDPDRAEMLKQMYRDTFNPASTRQLGLPFSRSGVSFTEAPQGKCRVIEVWHLENLELLRVLDNEAGEYLEFPIGRRSEIDKENSRRSELGIQPMMVRYECRPRWVRYFYSGRGDLISRDISPFPDGKHPFVFKLYPLTDGEIHPFVEDIVDQQRCINRMISVIDNIMAASAKGLLLYPVNLKPDNLSWNSIADRWTRTGGIIPFVARPGFPVPQQLTSSGLDAGASKLLDIQMNMMQNVSGVTDALMGKASSPASGVGRFEAEVRNATIALTDILDTYSDFISLRDRRLEGCAKRHQDSNYGK